MKFPIILNSADQKRTIWSGGTTTELFIMPIDCAFVERDFDFRISTATVELEASTFTPLNGYKRVLMVMDGQMTLEHESHHTAKLKKFDVDRFDGAWKTKSLGTCVDFNVIFRGDLTINPQGIVLMKGDWLRDQILNVHFVLVYCYAGELTIAHNESLFTLTKGDIWVCDSVVEGSLVFEATTISDFVYLKISKQVDGN